MTFEVARIVCFSGICAVAAVCATWFCATIMRSMDKAEERKAKYGEKKS